MRKRVSKPRTWGHELHPLGPITRAWIHADASTTHVLSYHARASTDGRRVHRALTLQQARRWAKRLGVDLYPDRQPPAKPTPFPVPEASS